MSDEAQAPEVLDTSVTDTGTADVQEPVATQEEPTNGLLAGKYKSVEELASAYKNLETKLGERPQLKVPGEDATEEERQAYTAELRKLNGVPESVDKYGVKAPDGFDEGQFNGFLNFAHENGMTPTQVEAFLALSKDERAAQSARKQDEEQGWQDEAKMEWGDKFKANESLVNRFVASISPDGKLDEMLGKSLYHPVIRTALLEAAKFIPEPSLKGGEGASMRGADMPSKSTVKERFRDPRYADPAKRDPDFVRETDELWETLHEGEVYRGGPLSYV